MFGYPPLRETPSTHWELAQKLHELEQKYERHDAHIQDVFEAIRQLIEQPVTRETTRHVVFPLLFIDSTYSLPAHTRANSSPKRQSLLAPGSRANWLSLSLLSSLISSITSLF